MRSTSTSASLAKVMAILNTPSSSGVTHLLMIRLSPCCARKVRPDATKIHRPMRKISQAATRSQASRMRAAGKK